MIDLNSYITNSNHFKWSEALWLNSIKTYHLPSDIEHQNIIDLCIKLDKVRDFIAKPFHINCWIRPSSVNDLNGKYNGFDYNKLVGGAFASSHIVGRAVDFVVSDLSVDDVMKLIIPKLKEFELCAENNGSKAKRNWIHLDNNFRSGWRIFNP